MQAALFQQAGRPARDDAEPDWGYIAKELKRKGVTLSLLWDEYRAAHPDGYGYTWFCTRFRAFERRINPRYRNRHDAGAAVQTDYAGHTIPVFNPATGKEHQAQIFVAVLGASNYTFAWASLTQRLPDWIDAQARALKLRWVPKALICDNLSRRRQAALVRAVADGNLRGDGNTLRHNHLTARQGEGGSAGSWSAGYWLAAQPAVLSRGERGIADHTRPMPTVP